MKVIYIVNEFFMTVTEKHKCLILRNDAKKINDNFIYSKYKLLDKQFFNNK